MRLIAAMLAGTLLYCLIYSEEKKNTAAPTQAWALRMTKRKITSVILNTH